jgi:hypothetical protein
MSDPVHSAGDSGGKEPQQGSLGILFIAAALALAAFLTVVGLIAFAMMSR